MSYTRMRRSYGAQKSNRSNYRRKSSKPKSSASINPRRFIKVAKTEEVSEYQPTHMFNDFQISDLLKTNLSRKGYKVPSPIQDQAIPLALESKDIIGIASTGTGKTAAFIVPIIQKLSTQQSSAALIIAPTRELAQQIETEFKEMAKGFGIRWATLIGGSSMGYQLKDLRNNPRVIFGTPGRIQDHLKRGSLSLSKFNMVVLDEVDRMLDMGFINDVTEILKFTSGTRQSLFFSATLGAKVQDLAMRFSNSPVTISIKASSTSENVHQDIIGFGNSNEKIEKLHNLLINQEVAKAIVFDETQRNVDRLNQELIDRGFSVEAIHGGKTQSKRQRALKKFKDSEVNILVATDVAARGLDVKDITHVVNYSIPREYDDYIHRVGRAGRAGKMGYAYTFVSSKDI
ncbi:DEAD/DEAH box helicase [Candidatus Saccharibacteria bacterium]|nr:DEAD/DEAH box helicase [Candidatus Saccharibacteria bacterium]